MTSPLIYWFRRDLRLSDHPGLVAAVESGRPIIPVFILDPETERLGAAPRWRLGEGVRVFADGLKAAGSRLILRRGSALEVLKRLVAETGAEAVHWSRLYDPASTSRDTGVKAALKEQGLDVKSRAGHVLFDPPTVQTGTGGYYKVYTPFWKAVHSRDVPTPLAAPKLPVTDHWPASDALESWGLGRDMQRGAEIVAKHAIIGEAAAHDRLRAFVEERLARYAAMRDRLDRDATSGLSENLSLGEISPRQCWYAALNALGWGDRGAEKFLKEVVWRDFAYHLLYHSPDIATRNWRPEWDGFDWDEEGPASERWCRAMTGEPVVDAALREMYVTGRMHNRARMIVASYLTKHLLTDWRVGLRWFEDCLIDWDPASNALGWQWTAGSGPDAAPYFRVFNPATQAEKFDPNGAYRRRWIAEISDTPGEDALDYFRAIPKSWGLSPDANYSDPVVGLKEGREAALAAYEDFKSRTAA